MAASLRAMAAALALALAPGLVSAGPAGAQAVPPAAEPEADHPDAPRMLAVEHELVALAGAGRLAEAQALLDTLIEMEVAAYGPHDWRVGNSWSYRAGLLEQAGDLAGAEAARRREVEIRRDAGDALALAEAEVSLAVVLTLRDKQAEALAMLRRVGGALPADARMADVRRRLALTEAHSLTALDRPDEAAAVLAAAHAEAVAEGAGLAQGAQWLPTRVAQALTVALLDSGRAAEAEDPARRACAAFGAAETPPPDLAALSCFGLASVLEDLDRKGEATTPARQALAAEALAATPSLIPANRARAAQLAVGAADDPDHERYLRLALEAEAQLAPGSAGWANAANALGLWLTGVDRADEAEPLLGQAEAAYLALSGPDALSTVIVRGNRVDALRNSGRPAEAEALALVVLPQAIAQSGLEGVRYVLLDALAGRPAEAERLATAMLAAEPSHAHRVDLYSRLANLASDRGDWPAAVGWRAQLLEAERRAGAAGRPLMTAIAYYGRAALEARDYVTAYRHLSEALALLDAFEDPDPVQRAADRLYLVRHLSSAALYHGYEDEADRLSQDALDRARTAPVNAQGEISALLVRADLMVARSDLAAAESYLAQALVVARNEDDDGESVVVVESQQSFLWKMQGRYEEAEAAMRRGIDHARRRHGAESLATAIPLKNLASLLSETGRSERALPLLQQAAAIEATWLPPDNAERMLTQVRLATLMTDAGQAEAALAVLSDLADQAEARLGAAHWVSLQARERLGWALARLERFDEAGAHFQRTVLAVEDAKGPDSFDLMGPLQALAYALYMDGRYEETLEVMRRAAAVGDTGGGRWQRSLSSVKSNLGVTLMALGRPAEAVAPLREAAALSRQGVVSRTGEGTSQIDPDRFAFRKLVQALFLSAQSG